MKSADRFSRCANDYAVARPSYPEQAIDALFIGYDNPSTLTVVDLGAGTGISSRLLAARGATVIAIEPNAAMRGRAAAAPNVVWKVGTAEDTGLQSGSADVVCAFQAFHWFEYDAALGEMARILRTGGRAATIYNERDDRDAFTAKYSRLVRRHATDETEARRSDGRARFQAYTGWKSVRVVEIANEQILDRDGLHARARSTSYLPTQGDAAETLHAQIDALFDEYGTAGTVTMFMKTIVIVALLTP